MAEGNSSYDEVCATLATLNLTSEYEESFKENEMTDELVIDCVRGDLSFLKQIIPVVGHQMKFIKEFSSRKGIESPCSGPNGKKNVLVRQDSGDPAKVSQMQDLLLKSSDSNEMNMFERLADTLGLAVKSRKAVFKKIHAEAVDLYDKEMEKRMNESEYLEDEEMEALIDEAEETAIDFFINIVSPLEVALQIYERKVLEQTLEARGHVLKKKNDDNKIVHQLELQKEADCVSLKYIDLIKSELGDGVISKEQLVALYEQHLPAAEEEYEKQCGSSKLFDLEILSKRIEGGVRILWEQLESRNLQLQKKTLELTSNMLGLYEEIMSEVIDEVGLDEAHAAAVIKVEEKIGNEEGLDEHSKNVSLGAFYRRLEDAKSKASDDLKARTRALLNELAAAKVEAIESYRKLIQPLIAKGTPIAEAVLTVKHISSKSEANKVMQASLLKIQKKMKVPEGRIDPIVREAEIAIETLHEEYEKVNAERWLDLRSELEKMGEDYQKTYSIAMEEVAEGSMSTKEFEAKEKRLRDRLLNEYTKKISMKTPDYNHQKQLVSEFVDFMNGEKVGYKEVFIINQKETDFLVKAALFEARKYYNEEMEKIFQSKPWFEPEDLRKIHLEVLENSVLSSRAEITLSENQERPLREALEVVFSKYDEDNRRRLPHKIPAIGIDLGTTYSCVGVYIDGAVKIIPNIQLDEKTTIPSYVAFNDDGSIDVGSIAKERSFRNPQNTIFDAKRLIGRKYAEKVVQDDIKLWPFDVSDVDGEPRIKVNNKAYRPEEISAKVLSKLKEIAENYLQRKVTKAIITVPAYFGDAQRKATKDAAEIAKLDATILNEPTAAAIAYQLHRTGDLQRNVLIFDLGGGTFDVAVLSMEKGGIEVKAIGGDTHLGGEDFDQKMVEAIIERVKTKYGIDLSRGRHSSNSSERLKASSRLRRLRSYCEEQKKNLSDAQAVIIAIDMLDDNFDLNEEFTREEFNAINMADFEKCISIVEKTLVEAEMAKEKIDDIVMVGGSTRIPKVQEMLKKFFDNKKELSKRINPDEAVACGAAFQAALLHGEQVEAGRNQMRFVDVTPKSLGVAVYRFPGDKVGKMSVVIPKNTPVPCSKTRTGYCTMHDLQTVWGIKIYEGEDKYVKNNVRLGKFDLSGIPPAPAGVQISECTMDIDKEGILHVTGNVVTNGSKAKLRIETYNGRMTKKEKEVAKMQEPFRWA